MYTALLFAGQGTQAPGFLARLPEHAEVRATIAEASEVLAVPAPQLDGAAALESTVGVQLATVIAGVAVARALTAEGFAAQAVAGLSVGAFAAAVACGVLSFADALRLVRLRGEAMMRAVQRGHGMSAILGLGERDVLRLIARVSERSPLYLASVNAPTEIVVSGDDTALARAAEEARAAGAGARRLRVGIPSHCPLMESVSAALRTALAGMPLHAPRLSYVTNTRARVAPAAAGVAEDLILNVSRTVRWHDSMRLLFELGCRLFVETPPGDVLTGLVGASFPDARALALERSPLASAVALARQAP
jgi:malonate decarboxylase epsilon subunit